MTEDDRTPKHWGLSERERWDSFYGVDANDSELGRFPAVTPKLTSEGLRKLVYDAVDSVELTYDYCYCDDVCVHGDGYLDRGEVVDAVVAKLLASGTVSVST